MKGKLKDQNGAVAVILAISIAMILGFTAIVVDIGYLFEVRRQLQSAADAAALAGCQELIKDKSNTEILAVAEDYAKRNDFGSDLGTSEALFMHPDPPDTEVGADYVQVTVEKNMNLFFARIWNRLNAPVTAQAKAQIVYLTGARNLMPWGLNIIEAEYATAKARIGDGEPQVLAKNGNTFSGDLTVPTAAAQTGYPVTVTISYDHYGQPGEPGYYAFPEVTEVIAPAGNVIVHQPTDPIKEVTLSDSFPLGGGTTRLDVVTAPGSDVPKYSFDKNTRNMTYDYADAGGDHYYARLTAPSITNAVEYFPIDVSTGSGVGKFEILNAATLVVRRSTYPVLDVSLGQTNFLAGSGGTAHIDMTLNVLENWKEYDLKVVSGPETGNFNALNYMYVYRYPDYVNVGENHDAEDYYPNVGDGYPGIIYIGDIVQTKTGNLSEPQTSGELSDRFGTHNHTFEEWLANRHDSCPRIVFVPIVERIDRGNGSSEVIVVNFAAFYITEYEKTTGNIRGVFVPDIHPGEYTDKPPLGDLSLKTARLVPPNF